MALSRVTPQGQHLEKALDTAAVLAHWHQALGLGEPAGTPGWSISASTWHKLGNSLDQGRQCRHGEVWCLWDAHRMLSPADPMGFGAGWHFYPQHPFGPQFSKAPGCRQGGSGTGQDRSLALTRMNRPRMGLPKPWQDRLCPSSEFGEKQVVMALQSPHQAAMAPSTPRLLPFQNNHAKNGKWQQETSLGVSMVPLLQLPTATQRTVGRDGSPPPPSQRYTARAALCSLVAHAPAPVSVRASLCWVTFQWPSHPPATGCPSCPYG